jgi:FtsH-binding integral membrane protein
MTNRTLLEWAYSGLYAALLVAATFVLSGHLAAWCSTGCPPPALASVSQLVQWLRHKDQSFNASSRLLGALRFVFLFGAALACLTLVFDLRSRDFPAALFSVPAVGLALLAWIKGKREDGLEEILLAGWIGFAGLWIAVAEHIIIVQGEPWRLADGINQHALEWAVLCLLLAGSVLIPVFVELRTGQRQNA